MNMTFNQSSTQLNRNVCVWITKIVSLLNMKTQKYLKPEAQKT